MEIVIPLLEQVCPDILEIRLHQFERMEKFDKIIELSASSTAYFTIMPISMNQKFA